MSIRHALLAAAIAGFLGVANAGAADNIQLINPYAGIEWDKVEYLHSFSHQHGDDPQVFSDMGFGHLPLSNYYPSRPIYPLPAAFLKKHPDVLGTPNAEHHSTTDASYHFCTLGSFYTAGYGKTPSIKPDVSPIEYVFTGLNVFDSQKSPWLGVYRLDLRFVPVGKSKEPMVSVTIEGATHVSHKTFAPVGDGVLRGWPWTAKMPDAIYLKTESDKMRVRLEFDPATTRITRFRLMQGTNRPWQDAFRAALDGTQKNAAGRPIEGLLFPDGGGITLNHPGGTVKPLLQLLDFDPRVLGIEVWNDRSAFGGTNATYYGLWDDVLRTGRPCFGFFVKDHSFFGRGRNVLLVAGPSKATRLEREHEALRAYRAGRFFGMLGALKADESDKLVPPYDKSDFRFTRIAVKEEAGVPAGVEVAVDGTDRSKRPNTQIRFVTDAGVARVANSDRAYFEFPLNAEGKIRCRYVRVEAFAYPNTHQGGKPLTAEALTAMNVHEIARIHDRLWHFELSKIDPSGQTPIPIVDMIFSQPILVRTNRP